LKYSLKTSDAIALLKDLPSKSVSMILTDPPYNIGVEKRGDFGFSGLYGSESSKNKGKTDWDSIEFQIIPFLQEAKRVLTTRGCLIFFFDVWKITPVRQALQDLGFNNIRLLTWEKTNPSPFKTGSSGYLPSVTEHAIFAMQSKRGGIDTPDRHTGIFRHPKPNRKQRGIYSYAMKPLDLLTDMIERHTIEGETIVDPFMGSGSTAIAALKLKRKFIGGDIHNDFVEAVRSYLFRNFPNCTEL
jgi:site-specific DNA-methyltransferase (adenine-specific)